VYEAYLPQVKTEGTPKLEIPYSNRNQHHEEDSIEMELSSSIPKSNGFVHRPVVKYVDDDFME